MSSFRAVHVRSQTYSQESQLLSSVTTCRQSLGACARSLGSNCKQVDKPICFSSQVSAWRIQCNIFRVWPIHDMCMLTVSGEIDRVSAIVFGDAFGPSCRIDRIAAPVSCPQSPPGTPSFRNSSLPQRILLIHRKTEARQYAAEPYTFQRHITIFSPAHCSNRKNSITAHCLSLTFIVTFRFWQLRNRHRNPLYGIIPFGMWDLSVMRHEMFHRE
jgi:hypothetical protein